MVAALAGLDFSLDVLVSESLWVGAATQGSMGFEELAGLPWSTYEYALSEAGRLNKELQGGS